MRGRRVERARESGGRGEEEGGLGIGEGGQGKWRARKNERGRSYWGRRQRGRS